MENLSDQSRLWIYQAGRDLDDEEIRGLESETAAFCEQWTAHNKNLKSSFKILYRRFIILIVDETQTDASGCSIDKSVAFLRTVSERLKTDLFDRLQMAYLENGKVKTLSLQDIGSAYKNRLIQKDTLFFNPQIQTLGELKNKFLIPFEKHWLAGFESLI